MANKAIFFDRDDTLIEDPGYINDPDQVKILDGVPEALITLRAMGYKLVVVSNQSAVARGIVTEEVLTQIHNRLEQLLAQEGASIDRIYFCPYHPEGAIAKYRRDSDHRKPNPGMLLDAGKDMDIDLNQSWMVGNSPSDIEAGVRAGCKTILIDRRGQKRIQPGAPGPDYRAVNLKEVINIIKMNARFGNREQIESSPPVQAAPQQTIDERRETKDEDSTLNTEQRAQNEEVQETPAEEAGPQGIAELSATRTAEQPVAGKTEELLTAILEQLKGVRRSGMYSGADFSFPRLIAGVLQAVVGFCLLISIWFLLGPDKQTDRLLIALGFAAVLQLMALTLYTMQGPK